jgi:hypothetical protein
MIYDCRHQSISKFNELFILKTAADTEKPANKHGNSIVAEKPFFIKKILFYKELSLFS